MFYGTFELGANLAGGGALRRLEGGVAMLRTLHVAVGVAYAWLLLSAYRRAAGSLPLACAGLIILASIATVLRPQVLGQVCFAALLWQLSGMKTEAARVHWRLAWTMPLLFVLWANLHGSFLIGFYLAGLYWLGSAIQAGSGVDGWRLRRALAAPEHRPLLLGLIAATAAVACLNPHGPMLFLRAIEVGRHPNISWFDEWRPLQFDLGEFRVLRYLLSAATGAASTSWSWRRRIMLPWRVASARRRAGASCIPATVPRCRC